MDNIHALKFQELPPSAQLDTIKNTIEQLEFYIDIYLSNNLEHHITHIKLYNHYTRMLGSLHSLYDKLENIDSEGNIKIN